MYCGQRLGDYCYRDIAEYFSLSHPGGVASAIKSVREELEVGELNKQLMRIQRDLNVV